MDAVWFYKTSGKQVPGEYSQLFEPVYLAGTAAPSSEIAARDMSIGDFSGFSYCSSSEHDNVHSWGQSFYSADQNYYVKNYDNQIQAVRAF